jgi:hypothetical protein
VTRTGIVLRAASIARADLGLEVGGLEDTRSAIWTSRRSR